MMHAQRLQIENRAEPRVVVKLPGRLFYGPGLVMWADCVIRNLSASGAKVDVAAVFALPSRLVLADLRNGVAFDVVMKWRRGDVAGLQFQARHELRSEVEERLAGVRGVWFGLSGLTPTSPPAVSAPRTSAPLPPRRSSC